MAFGGYEVWRSNIYNYNISDNSGIWWNKKEAISALKLFVSENKVGDVIIIWAEETEDTPTLCVSVFNSPTNGLVMDVSGDIDIQDKTLAYLEHNGISIKRK